ncbi:MAG: hypothetical protein Cons2KO_10780 [Congregibacter sp.]
MEAGTGTPSAFRILPLCTGRNNRWADQKVSRWNRGWTEVFDFGLFATRAVERGFAQKRSKQAPLGFYSLKRSHGLSSLGGIIKTSKSVKTCGTLDAGHVA